MSLPHVCPKFYYKNCNNDMMIFLAAHLMPSLTRERLQRGWNFAAILFTIIRFIYIFAYKWAMLKEKGGRKGRKIISHTKLLIFLREYTLKIPHLPCHTAIFFTVMPCNWFSLSFIIILVKSLYCFIYCLELPQMNMCMMMVWRGVAVTVAAWKY